MNQKVLFYLTVLSLLLMSCNVESNEQEIEVTENPTDMFETKIELTHEEVELTGIELGGPEQLLVMDSLLVIRDQFEVNEETYFYALVNRHSGVGYQIFGREGRGPDEFLDFNYMFRTSSNTISINERRLFAVNEVSIDSILVDASAFTVSTTDELNTGYSLISKIGDDRIFGTGMFTDGRFALSDTSGELINTFLNYPFEDEFDGISTRDLGMAYQSNFSFHPTKPLVAVANFTAGNLDILRVENDSIEEVSQIYSHQPKFENQSSETQISVMFDADNKMGYWDNDVTEEYIYALYSGRERTDPNQSTGNKVLVFDWEGNPIEQLNLDVEVSGITVDQNNETLYAIANDDNNEAFIATFSLD
ncbi:MAG: BF3164 family lipoprotein [Balneolaceae bacterium]